MRKRKLWEPREYVEMWESWKEKGMEKFREEFGFSRAQADGIIYKLKRAAAGERTVGNQPMGKSVALAGVIIAKASDPSPSREFDKEERKEVKTFTKFTKLFEQFKEDLVKIMAELVDEGQKEELRQAKEKLKQAEIEAKKGYAKGYSKGRLDERARQLKGMEKSSAGGLFQRAIAARKRKS